MDIDIAVRFGTGEPVRRNIEIGGSSYPNRSIAENKYNEIVSTVSAIESRDNRLMSITGGNKLTTLRNRLSTNYTEKYNTGTLNYNNIKTTLATLSSVNNKLK